VRPSLFLHVVGLEARKRMAYRADFWIQSFGVFLAEVGLVWFLWQALFREAGTPVVAGWDLDSTVLYYVAVILVAKLVRGNDLDGDSVSNDVYEGSLSRYLLYPAPYVGLKYAQKLGALWPALVQFVLFGAVFPFFLAGGAFRPTLASVGMGLGSILVGNLLYFLMTWPLHGIAFWADNVWSLIVALRLSSGLLGGTMLPLSVFPDWSQPWLAALPFRHCFAEPVLALLGRTSPQAWLATTAIGLLWCAVFAAAGWAVFARGRYRYTGVGI
jgi:ABC-2 type transport system permease protein